MIIHVHFVQIGENDAFFSGLLTRNFFNDFEALDDDEIKRVSNTWMMYYLDYWNKKGTDKEYDEDPLCEEFPLK